MKDILQWAPLPSKCEPFHTYKQTTRFVHQLEYRRWINPDTLTHTIAPTIRLHHAKYTIREDLQINMLFVWLFLYRLTERKSTLRWSQLALCYLDGVCSAKATQQWHIKPKSLNPPLSLPTTDLRIHITLNKATSTVSCAHIILHFFFFQICSLIILFFLYPALHAYLTFTKLNKWYTLGRDYSFNWKILTELSELQDASSKCSNTEFHWSFLTADTWHNLWSPQENSLTSKTSSLVLPQEYRKISPFSKPILTKYLQK